MQIYNEDGQLMMYAPDGSAGKTSQERSAREPRNMRTSALSWKKLLELKAVPFMSLDLTPGHGNLLGESYWEIVSPWLGGSSMLNTGPAPLSDEGVSSLSQILEDSPPRKYYLSKTACLGILRRASVRGKELPEQLKTALELQSGVRKNGATFQEMKACHINQRDEGIDLHGVSGALMATTNMQMQTFITQSDQTVGFDGYNSDLTGDVSATLGTNCGMSTDHNGVIKPIAFAANQRDEVRDLHGVAGALGAQPGMKQQTFIAAGVVTKGSGDAFLTPERHTSLTSGGGQAGQGYPCVLTAGFCAGAAPTAGGIGYQEEIAPTLKAAESGTNMVPSILCLNDQGGSVMDCSENITGTLRAQEHGHQPLILTSQLDEPEHKAVLYENHGIDSRYTGPHPVSPTLSARAGTGFSEPHAHDINSHDR